MTPPRPKENDEWIKENYSLYPLSVLWEMYCEKFRKISYGGFKNITHSLGINKKKKRTKEQISFLVDNAPNCTSSELAKMYSERYGEISTHEVLAVLRRNNAKCKPTTVQYSQEEINWIAENYPNHSVKELVDLFSKRFRPITFSGLNTWLSEHGFNTKLDTSHLTREQSDWLIENYDSFSVIQLAEMFSDLFFETTPSKLSSWALTRGLKKRVGYCGYYTDDEVDFFKTKLPTLDTESFISEYKAVFGNKRNMNKEMANDIRRRFKLPLSDAQKEVVRQTAIDTVKKRTMPIGTVSIVDGEARIKISEDKHGAQNFAPLKYYVWEQHYGKVPDGYHVICIDGNNTNCDLDNLMLVDYKTLHKLKWRNKVIQSDSKELKKLYIMTQQLSSLVED